MPPKALSYYTDYYNSSNMSIPDTIETPSSSKTSPQSTTIQPTTYVSSSASQPQLSGSTTITTANDTADDQPKKKRRRKPHTRAIKACDMCRRQKTRCLKSDNTISCLRCLSLNLNCSFEDDFKAIPEPTVVTPTSKFTYHDPSGQSTGDNSTTPGTSLLGYDQQQQQPSFSTVLDSSINSGPNITSSSLVNRALNLISTDLKDVLKILRHQNSGSLPDPNSHPRANNQDGTAMILNMNSSPVESILKSPFSHIIQTCTSLTKLNPTTHINTGLPSTILEQMNLTPDPTAGQTDLLTVNLLSYKQAIKLLDIFRDRYGRWISFPDNFTTEKLLHRIRYKCPLLLTVACSLSLKYSDPFLKDQIYDSMLALIKKDLEVCLLNIPNNLEFLQCLIILSIYGTGLSSDTVGLKLDSWYLSNVGIHLFLKLNSFGIFQHLYDPSEVEFEFNELTVYRIFNTLLLIHMAYTILSGKLPNYSLSVLKPKRFIELNSSTNFDYRIIAEIEIYIIGYRYLQLSVPLEIAKQEIKEWLSQWNYLFNKPANEFVEIDYHFVELIININVNEIDISDHNNRYVDFKDLQTFKIIYFHAIKILKLITSIKDVSYFAFLSDQIHLTVVYNTSVVIKLLEFNDRNKIKGDLQQRENLALVVSLIYRYKKIATSEIDSLSKYSQLLEDRLMDSFPGLNVREYLEEHEGGFGVHDDDDADAGEEEEEDEGGEEDEDDDDDDDDDERRGLEE